MIFMSYLTIIVRLCVVGIVADFKLLT